MPVAYPEETEEWKIPESVSEESLALTLNHLDDYFKTQAWKAAGNFIIIMKLYECIIGNLRITNENIINNDKSQWFFIYKHNQLKI